MNCSHTGVIFYNNDTYTENMEEKYNTSALGTFLHEFEMLMGDIRRTNTIVLHDDFANALMLTTMLTT